MKKRTINLILLWTVILAIAASLGVTFYKTVVKGDFTVIESEYEEEEMVEDETEDTEDSEAILDDEEESTETEESRDSQTEENTSTSTLEAVTEVDIE